MVFRFQTGSLIGSEFLARKKLVSLDTLCNQQDKAALPWQRLMQMREG
jgi:hypothetical protein